MKFIKKELFLFFFIIVKTVYPSHIRHKNENNKESKKAIIVQKVLKLFLDKDIRCFLNIIALFEGTSKQNKADMRCFHPSWSEYQTSFAHASILDLQEYPNKLFCRSKKAQPNNKDFCGSAAGRYQFIKKTWHHLTKKFPQEKIFQNNKDFFNNLIPQLEKFYTAEIIEKYKSIDDILQYKFGPFWQDFYAIILLFEAKIINLIKNKNIEKMSEKISYIWPSFPKNKNNENRYNDGINKAKPYAKVIKIFEKQMLKG